MLGWNRPKRGGASRSAEHMAMMRDAKKWQRMAWKYEMNKMEGDKVKARIRPEPTNVNAELFLLSELWLSHGAEEREPVWRCPIPIDPNTALTGLFDPNTNK